MYSIGLTVPLKVLLCFFLIEKFDFFFNFEVLSVYPNLLWHDVSLCDLLPGFNVLQLFLSVFTPHVFLCGKRWAYWAAFYPLTGKIECL